MLVGQSGPEPPVNDFLKRIARVVKGHPYFLATGSGKGGVGKTTFAVAIARKLVALGHSVIVIDCDVEGSNCPRAFGVRDVMMTVGKDLEPVKVFEDLWLYAMELHPCARPGENAPVMLGETHRQFIRECIQAALRRKPEFILLDFPAGQGDTIHTLMNAVGKVDGMVLVSAPNGISTDNVESTILACKTLGIPILGVAENFSSFTCDGCKRVHHPFGEGAARKMAERHGLPFLGEQPIDPTVSANADMGVRTFNNAIVDRIVQVVTGGGP